VEAVLGLARQKDNRVTLSYRREALVRIKKKNEDRIASLIANGRVEALFSSEVLTIREDSVRLRLPSGEVERANDWVFVFAGGDPPFDLLRRAGVRFGGDPVTGQGAAGSGSPSAPPQDGPPISC
jgi:thioredoxin reductase